MNITETEIREINADDYEQMHKLWSETPGVGLSSADSSENIGKFLDRNKGFSFCCIKDDRIIATILCGHDGRRGYIYHVTVAQEYRGRGIGRVLVDRSLEKLKEDGIERCHLFVFADNELGNIFWNSTGWNIRNDIIVYSKNL